MKKRIFIALLLSVILILSACGGGGGEQGVRLSMATGGTGGTYYPFGGVMASVINNNTDINVTVNASGASADNIRQIAAGDAHVAIVQNDVMSYAFNGTEIWSASEPVKSMATLMSLYPETVHVIVTEESGIYSIEDLAGKRVSIGDVGSGVEANARQVLAAHGLGTDDINVFNLGFSPSADAMRDRQLDAFFVTSAAPNTAVMDLAQARDLRVLNITNEKIDQLMNTHPYYVRVTLTQSDYTFLTEAINTVAVQATLIATADMDEQVAYDIVKALIENQPDILAGHARGAYISAENAVQSISVDFHPGARRYFEEIGAL